LRSSDVIIADADKQFVACEFKQYADNMRIAMKTIFVETYHSIEMMKRYHDSLRQMYAIITTEISNIDLEITLQMTFKIINDSIELDELIFTLLTSAKPETADKIPFWLIRLTLADEADTG
jgi:predicted component of viral defense system (DUF524 family)